MFIRIITSLIILALLAPSAEPVLASSLSASDATAPADDAHEPPPPPFGPHFRKPPLQPQPVAPPRLAPAPEAPVQPRVETPLGPAFNWSETENYLILGTDRRPGGGSWRTDTVMLVGLDRALNRAAVFSIPRDLYVQIPGYGWGRINQVDYLGEQRNGEGGGPQLVSDVLSATLGVQTQHWVRLQMDGFVDIVDAIGGVTVHLDCPFYEPIFNLTTNRWDYFVLPAGEVQLDGESAYWFVRLRYRESDIGRGRRQRQFLWALRDQVMNANLILRFPELWGAFQNAISTDLGLFELIDLTRYGTSLDAGNVRAGGLSLSDLQGYRTAEGAAVLRIADPARVRSVVDGVWDAPAMIDTNRQDAERCPVLPAGATPSIPAELLPAETVEQDAEPAETAVEDEEATETVAEDSPPAATAEEEPAPDDTVAEGETAPEEVTDEEPVPDETAEEETAPEEMADEEPDSDGNDG
jgi:polyisoprenyl-teichoic acid--peptidoglycan teichoic acid transferase